MCPAAGGAGGETSPPLTESPTHRLNKVPVLYSLLLFHQEGAKPFPVAAGRALRVPLFPGRFILLTHFRENLATGLNLELLHGCEHHPGAKASRFCRGLGCQQAFELPGRSRLVEPRCLEKTWLGRALRFGAPLRNVTLGCLRGQPGRQFQHRKGHPSMDSLVWEVWVARRDRTLHRDAHVRASEVERPSASTLWDGRVGPASQTHCLTSWLVPNS